MSKKTIIAVLLGLLSMVVAGCGGNDFQAGNRLIINSIQDSAGSTAPVFYAVEETDDSGKDGDPDTGDDGEGDGFPDAEEDLVTALGSDYGIVEVLSEPRQGVEEGVELNLYEIIVSYVDANGATRDFAPPLRQSVAVSVPSGGVGQAVFILVSEEMKKDANGLRAKFLYGTDEERRAVSTMTAIVDVYARDTLNDDSVHAQGRIGVSFINPLVSKIPE